jgi:hypothetical protein
MEPATDDRCRRGIGVGDENLQSIPAIRGDAGRVADPVMYDPAGDPGLFE